jgi:hypothetical protein
MIRWLGRLTCWLFRHDPYYESGMSDECAFCGERRV